MAPRPITAEHKSTSAEISEKTSVSQKVTSDKPNKSEVKSTNDKKNPKEKILPITTEQKSTPAKVSQRTSVPHNISPDGGKESGVKSTNDKKKSKEKIAPRTGEQKSSSAERYEQISVPQKVTPEGPMKSGLKSTKSKKKNTRGKRGTGLQTQDNPDKKTPYQGSNKACGLFYCLDCKKRWFSPHTWANRYQICKGCDAEIYPHVQFRPQKGKGPKKSIRPHPQKLCQKCMESSKPCYDYVKSPTKKAANRQREE